MKQKIILIIMVMVLYGCIIGAIHDTSHLHRYKWKVLYKCFDDCVWHWMLCKTICMNEDGTIYNKHNNIKLGEWHFGSGIGISMELFSECGQLNGTIFLEPCESVGMNGIGYTYMGTAKVIKIFLVRQEPRKE